MKSLEQRKALAAHDVEVLGDYADSVPHNPRLQTALRRYQQQRARQLARYVLGGAR
jgi:2-polyprenyl-6-methoxyphenol hydroxylase-like FAD-dependent oxidoreductase